MEIKTVGQLASMVKGLNTQFFTFQQLDRMIDQGEKVSELLLIVPKGTLHSGAVNTRYGTLEVTASHYITGNLFVIVKRSEWHGILN